MGAIMFSATVATPGTPQRLTNTTTPALPSVSGGLSGPMELRGASIIFQADPNNSATHDIYIGGPTMNVAARTGIGLALAPGAFSPPIELDGTTSLSDFYIDVDTGATVKNVFVTVIG